MEYGGVGREDKHSRMGIASLVLAIFMDILQRLALTLAPPILGGAKGITAQPKVLV